MNTSRLARILINHKKPRIPFIFRFLSFLLRPLFLKRNTFGFVAHPGKPWSCNLDAFLTFLNSQKLKTHIYVINFSGVSSTEIISEYFSPEENIQVIGFEDPLKLLACCLRCKTFFVSDMSNYGLPGTVINLWHGIPMKNIGVFQNKKNKRLGKKFSYVISAQSQLDRNNMALAFNLPTSRVLDFGLPRHDWLMGTIPKNQKYLHEINKLKSQLGNRKLALYAPTFRDENKNVLPISNEEVTRIAQLLKKHNWTLGIRAHVISRPQDSYSLDNIISLSGSEYPHAEAVLECSDILITDYSSIAIDYNLTDKQIMGLDTTQQPYSRGFLLDFDTLFPGDFFFDFDAFLLALEENISQSGDKKTSARAKVSRSLLLGDYAGDACKRLKTFVFETLD